MCGVWSLCSLSLWSASVLTEISLNTWVPTHHPHKKEGKNKKKEKGKKSKTILPFSADWLYVVALPQFLARLFTTVP